MNLKNKIKNMAKTLFTMLILMSTISDFAQNKQYDKLE